MIRPIPRPDLAIIELARAAAEEVCQCSHKRESHMDSRAACMAGACACCSFRKVESS